MHYVQVALHVTEVDVLVQMRFLKEEERHDPERLQGAVMGLIYWVLEDPAMVARRRGLRILRFRQIHDVWNVLITGMLVNSDLQQANCHNHLSRALAPWQSLS
jgi:hypothetical protein